MLRFNAREETRLVLQLMWPALGTVKRAQAELAFEVVEQARAGDDYQSRMARETAPQLPPFAQRGNEQIERAWAAGFPDAEGCFGLNRGNKRVRGPGCSAPSAALDVSIGTAVRMTTSGLLKGGR